MKKVYDSSAARRPTDGLSFNSGGGYFGDPPPPSLSSSFRTSSKNRSNAPVAGGRRSRGYNKNSEGGKLNSKWRQESEAFR